MHHPPLRNVYFCKNGEPQRQKEGILKKNRYFCRSIKADFERENQI